MKEVKLPSGAVLKITLSPFKEAKALAKAFLREAKGISLNSKDEMAEVYKQIFCVGFSSEEIEASLKECFQRCLYNDMRITDDTFEPENARQDYLSVCVEVAKANLVPFGKNLFAEFQRFQSMTEKSPT